MRYRFADFELDVDAYVLRRGDQVIALQPKVFDVLRHLIEHRERVVSKEELLDRLWPGEHVNEAAVPWSISHARRALKQKRNQKRPIETIHGRGYRFTAEVEAVNPSVAPREAPSESMVPRARQSPFVGRDATMAQLQLRLEEARAGQGRLCLLRGEAGIGKTRCTQELSALARPLGVRVWSGRAVEGVGAPVFWPWIQILREISRDPQARSEEGIELLSRLMAWSPSKAPPDASDAESPTAGRFWLLDGVSRLLRETAKQGPLLLLLDDLHWADSGSLDLLRYLAPELRNAAILIVATQRPESEEATRSRLRSLARYGERILMKRLLPEDIARYLSELGGVGEVPRGLAAAIHKSTAGNPLFVQETVRALIATHGAEAMAALDPAEVRPPEVARDVLRGRLSELDEETRVLLSTASVLGVSFELGLLQRVSGLELDPLLTALENAAQAELILADAPHRHRFSHDLVRDVLYRDLATRERVRVHRAAAEWLSELPDEARYGETALHYYRSLPAGAYDRVTVHAVAAGDAARRVYAFDDAVVYYTWALEAQALDPDVTPRSRAELLYTCGAAQRSAGRDLAARETMAKLIDLARQHGYGDLLVRAARVLRPTHAMSGMPDPLLRGALEEYLRLHDQPTAERVSALSQLSCIPPYALDMERSKELSAEALGLARELERPSSLLEAMRARLYSLSGPDDIAELLALCHEIVGTTPAQVSWVSGEAHAARYSALVYCGDMAAADRALDDIERTSQELRLPEATWFAQRLRAQRLFVDGHFDLAETAYTELSKQNRRIGLSYGEAFVGLLRTNLAIERHGLAALLDPLGLTNEPQERARQAVWPSLRATYGRMAAELGRKERAQANLDAAAAAGFEDLPKDLAYLNTLANLALSAAILDDKPHAEALYALLRPYPKHNTPSGMLLHDGSVSRYLARLAVTLEQPAAEVEEHFQQALASNESMGARVQLAHTLRDYAAWLSTRGTGQQAASSEARRRAQELAASIGMYDPDAKP